MDDTILFIIVALIIILIPATLFLIRMLRAQAERENRSKRQRLDYQPSAKPVWVPTPVPISKYIHRQQPAAETGPDAALLEDCTDLQQSLVALKTKYSLDSFTIGTSDGLVFASSGGSTAQEDAASFSQNHGIEESAGVASFSLNHRGSDLIGIIRSQGIITGELQKHIERDTKDILNKWI